MEKLVCPANNPRAEGLECAKTCQNYDLECISHGCVSGCLCPKGMVRRLLFVFLPSFFSYRQSSCGLEICVCEVLTLPNCGWFKICILVYLHR